MAAVRSGAVISRRDFLTLSAAGASLLIAGCGQPSKASMRGGWVAVSASQMLLPLAQEAGYFQQHGVGFDLRYINGSTTALAALLGGDVDVLNLGGTTVVNAVAGGADLVIVGIFLNEILFRVMATPDIRSLDDLKGKTVAVTKVGNTDYLAWQLIKSRQGWADSDLRIAPAGDSAGQLAMLQSGAAQAIAVGPPSDVLALRGGAHLVFTLPEEEEKNTLAVTRRFATQQRETVLAMLRACIDSARRLKSDPAFAKQVMQKYLKESDQEFIDSGYEAYAKLWLENPYPDPQAFTKVIGEAAIQNPKAAALKPEQLLDPSFVQELTANGFIRT